MMIKNITQVKIFKISPLFVFLILSSCISLKQNDSKRISTLIDLYINEYESLGIEEPLESLIISKAYRNGKIEYIINDAPLSFFYGELNKKIFLDQNECVMGKYNDILCILKNESVLDYSNLFEEIDENIFLIAKNSSLINGSDGNAIQLDLSLLNWNPKLIMFFNSSGKTTNIITE